MKAATALITDEQQDTITTMGDHANLENDICAAPNVQVSRNIITPNGCHLTLVFPKEGRKGVREEIADLLLSTIINMEEWVTAITSRAMEFERSGSSMTAMEFLSQAYLLNQQIETNLRQIESLRSLAQSLQSFMGNEPVSHTRNVTSLQDTVVKILEQEEKLNGEIDRLVDLKAEIFEVISQVRETNLREILKRRHLCFESWQQIGKELGHTERWAQMRHERALIVVDAILSGRQAEQTAG